MVDMGKTYGALAEAFRPSDAARALEYSPKMHRLFQVDDAIWV